MNLDNTNYDRSVCKYFLIYLQKNNIFPRLSIFGNEEQVDNIDDFHKWRLFGNLIRKLLCCRWYFGLLKKLSLRPCLCRLL